MLAVRTSSCCLLKGPATDPIQANSRCRAPPHTHTHTPPALPSHTHIHTCALQTHKPHAHARTDECVSVCMRVSQRKGTWNYLQRTKSKIRGKKMPLRINLTTMLRKIPNLTPEAQKKNLVSLFQGSQKCLTKTEVENFLDKRIQAPHQKGPHTKLCVIPTRNRFIYRKKKNKI